MSRHMVRRLMELGLVEGDGRGLVCHLPFDGTLSVGERRLLEQRAFGNEDFKPVYSTSSPELPRPRVIKGRDNRNDRES